jgi:DNA-binding response OmpR family regulator
MVAFALRKGEYEPVHAGDAREAQTAIVERVPDLILLDWMLPGTSGLDLARRWRKDELTRDVPIIMLTARGDVMDRVVGLELGADDYLPKPFRIEELVARARALVRRAAGRADDVHRLGALSVDLNRMSAQVNGLPVALTPLEFRLLAYLLLHRDRTVPPGELLDHIYGTDDGREANAIEAIVTRLRRKLGPDAIRTRRGFGYSVGALA